MLWPKVDENWHSSPWKEKQRPFPTPHPVFFFNKKKQTTIISNDANKHKKQNTEIKVTQKLSTHPCVDGSPGQGDKGASVSGSVKSCWFMVSLTKKIQ